MYNREIIFSQTRLFFIAVGQEVKSIDKSVLVHELELAIERDL